MVCLQRPISISRLQSSQTIIRLKGDGRQCTCEREKEGFKFRRRLAVARDMGSKHAKQSLIFSNLFCVQHTISLYFLPSPECVEVVLCSSTSSVPPVSYIL